MLNQRAIRNYTYSTVTLMQAATGRDGELTYCEETNTRYKYIASGSSYTANSLSVLTTGNAGNTRWVGMYGNYTYVATPTDVTVTQPVTTLTTTILEAPLKSAILKGRTVANILGSIGDCESTTGWGTHGSSLSLDSSNKIFGSNGFKIIDASPYNNPNIEYDVWSRVAANKYYFLSGYIKNNDAINCKLHYYNGSTYTFGTTITATTWTRTGLLINTTGLSALKIGVALYATDSNRYCYVDGIKLDEISSSDYTNLTVDQLLQKYPYHSDVKGSDICRVTSIGKNLFDKSKAEANRYIDANGNWQTSVGNSGESDWIKTKPNSIYVKNGLNCIATFWDINKTFISSYTNTSLTTPINSEYTRISTPYAEWDTLQLELGSVATTYEPYKSTSAIVPVVLNSVSDTIYDTFDMLTGKHVKNVSDVVTLSGNAYGWYIHQDSSGLKMIKTGVEFGNSIDSSEYILKYNNKKLVPDSSGNVGDSTIILGGKIYITTYDTDTGWDEAWVAGTSFTALTWDGLIKAYMNGWKLTTANVDVASCVWTGITSGTVKNAGAADYTHVTTNIDVGFQPYRMYYQLATPVVTNYPSNVLTSYPNGTIITEPFVEDRGTYTTLLIPTDVTTRPIGSLSYVNKITTDAITKQTISTPVALSTCTVAALGASFTSTSLTLSDYVEYGYITVGISSQASLTYATYSNLAGAEQGLAKQTENLDINTERLQNQIKYLLGLIDDMFQEQADVAVTINATNATETTVLDLSTASINYILRDLRIKSADPGANTVTVRLYQLVNNVLTVTDTFAITTANYTTFYSLMDMFGIPNVAGGSIKIAVQTDAGTYAITGQYAYAKTL